MAQAMRIPRILGVKWDVNLSRSPHLPPGL